MEGNTKVYIIEYQNYHGEYYNEYYLNPETALKKLMVIMDEAKHEDEYECDSVGSFSFFDANYNSDSTYINLSETKLKNLFQDWEDKNANN